MSPEITQSIGLPPHWPSPCVHYRHEERSCKEVGSSIRPMTALRKGSPFEPWFTPWGLHATPFASPCGIESLSEGGGSGQDQRRHRVCHSQSSYMRWGWSASSQVYSSLSPRSCTRLVRISSRSTAPCGRLRI